MYDHFPFLNIDIGWLIYVMYSLQQKILDTILS
jgi:hypothetical protein